MTNIPVDALTTSDVQRYIIFTVKAEVAPHNLDSV